ncbi:unnamed protein product [Nippostrongylus brasiliensis]|uniref:Helo_like_N domain-containing protein n=1 Tax=Nippostrongylus brasiliensis TaxID=27835 RepID=A0A0N4YK71_NIPBR|nr:unnamed protein product [Nippostrongylus brasiliensis]
MVDPITLKTKKSLVIRYTNNLRKIVERIQHSNGAPQSRREAVDSGSISAKVYDLHASTRLLTSAIEDFTSAIDTIEGLPEEQETLTHEDIETALELIEEAQCLVVLLESTRARNPPADAITDNTEMVAAKLPAIPIPVFSGKISDFLNSWTLFDVHVHSKRLPNLMKFNYLIDSLRGEAWELIKRYPVTETNYDHAIHLLKEKLGNQFTLITNLQPRLKRAKADNSAITTQRKLLEYVTPIFIQLEDLGVYTKGSYWS